MNMTTIIAAVLTLAATGTVLAAETSQFEGQKFGRDTVHPRGVAADASAKSSAPVLSRKMQSEVKDRKTNSLVRSGE